MANFVSNSGDSFQFEFTLKALQTSVDIKGTVPGNADGGDYTIRQVQYYNGKRYINIPVTPANLHVIPPPPSKKILPSKATIKINLNQRQFIRAQAIPLMKIRSELLAKLDKSASYSELLRQSLIDAMTKADMLLPEARDGYIARYEQKPILPAVVFEDFHRNYTALLIELKNNQAGAHAEGAKIRPSFITVQLSKRGQPTTDADRDWLDHNLVGSYPSLAKDTLILINENIRAYLTIGDTGLDTFSIRLLSIPAGAKVFYMRIGEGYKPLGKVTDVPSAIFPFALWTFRFEKDGCDPYTQPVDPYVDAKPEIYVELVCKK
jgi:hypothetical protein